MSEIAIREDRGGELAPREEPTNDLVEWAYAARQAHQIAVSLAGTSFVPKAMQRRPDEVCGAILAGRELGLSPMSALRSIDIIDGTPAIRAHTLRGLVQHHGHEVWVEESTSERAIVKGQRKGSSRIETSTWTMDRARKAGLANKKNWSAHPTAMLVARATAEVCRLIAADVLLGMPYCAEELGDGDAAATTGATLVAVEPKGKRTAQRRTARGGPFPEQPEPQQAEPAPQEPPAPEAVLAALGVPTTELRDDDDAPVPAVVDADGEDNAPPRVTDAQLKCMAVGFRQAGITERGDRLAFASRVVGRDIDTSKDLTVSEARAVIDALVQIEEAAIDTVNAGGDDPRWPELRGDR